MADDDVDDDEISIEENSVYFTNGFVRSADCVYLSAKLNAYSEENFSRVYTFENGEWEVIEVDASVKAVCYHAPARQAFCMGKEGLVVASDPAGEHEEVIADVTRFGFLNQIKSIAGELYICGYGGQVYRRGPGGWQHQDQGVLESTIDASSVDLQDIDGLSADDLYVVGTGGNMHHYDGSRWSRIDSPTNRHLLRVLAVAPDEVYVSGSGGTLLVGSRGKWQDISHPNPDLDFWGMAHYRGDLYLAFATGLVRRRGGQFEYVKPVAGRTLSHHRLHANDGVLWSFGLDDLFWFDGTTWHEEVCPDNDPANY